MCWMVWDLNPSRNKGLFCSQKRPGRLQGSPSRVFNGCLGYLVGVKQPGHDVCLPPSSIDVMKEWCCTSTPSACVPCVHRNNFTFLNTNSYKIHIKKNVLLPTLMFCLYLYICRNIVKYS
jgi:hypothetical protein